MKVSWEKNWEICCSLGMLPLSLDSLQEQQCLTTLNATLNYNYWTGGTQQGCRGSWKWCGGEVVVRSVDDFLKWEKGQPDNKGGNAQTAELKSSAMN